MLRNGLRQTGPRPAAAAACCAAGVQPARGKRVPGQRPGQVHAAVQRGVQGGGVRHLVLGDVLEEVRGAGKTSPLDVATWSPSIG